MSLKDTDFSFPTIVSQFARARGDEYLIQSKDDPSLYWSNEYGWTDKELAEGFTKEESEFLNLPIDGVWYIGS